MTTRKELSELRDAFLDEEPLEATATTKYVSALSVEVVRLNVVLDGVRRVVEELSHTQDPGVVEHYDMLGMKYTPAQVQTAFKKIYDDLLAVLPEEDDE